MNKPTQVDDCGRPVKKKPWARSWKGKRMVDKAKERKAIAATVRAREKGAIV